MKTKIGSFAFLAVLSAGMISCGTQAHQHKYDFDHPEWNWVAVENGYQADATLTCSTCDKSTEGHTVNVKAAVSGVTVDPKCEEDGSITYTATATYADQTFVDTKVEVLEKLGHEFKTIALSGDYKTSYNAMDKFDTSNLVVTATCGRDGCGESKVLTSEEYFVIYQTSGADHLCAGDTKVVISAGFARAEIDGLTVAKIPNAINGMEDHYSTSCLVAPNLSGVTSPASNLTIKYFADAQCTEEVDASALEEGEYFIKATSGDQNYEEVSKIATLTVEHAFDQRVQGDEYICAPATKFEEATYYKSCKCGESSASPDLAFKGSGSKLPEMVAESLFIDYSVTEMEAPEGYKLVTEDNRTYTNDDQGNTFLANIDVAPIEDTIDFKILTKNRKLCDSSWINCLQMDTWYDVKITKNSDLTFSSAIMDENGVTVFGYQNKASIPEVLPYYNFDGDAPAMKIYCTEIYGLRCNDETFGVLASNSSVNEYVTVNMMSPKGYQTVTKSTKTYGEVNQGNVFLSDIAMDKYESVSFAFLTKNRKFSLISWKDCVPMNVWNTATIERNADGTFTSTLVSGVDGSTKVNVTNAKTFRDAMPYYNYDGDAPEMEWYSTEVRGVLRELPPLNTVIIDDNVICGNGATTVSSGEAAPEGFTKVGFWETESDLMHGMLYSGSVLTNYSSVSFAIKTSGYFLFDGWDPVVDGMLWTIITLTNNNDNTWNLTATNLKGDVLYTKNGLSSYKGEDPGVYTNYALNTILYGNPGVGFIPSKKSGTKLVVYATELRGVAK